MLAQVFWADGVIPFQGSWTSKTSPATCTKALT